MKILHTADWHLGHLFHGYTRTEEHRHFLDWLLNIIRERQPDALLITGNVFDTAHPSAQAEELLYNFLQSATTALPGLQIVLIAGSHDSASRLEAPAALLKAHNVYVRGTIHYQEDEPDYEHYILPLSERGDDEARCVCLALPFLRCGDYPAGMTPAEGMKFYFKKLQKTLRKSDFKKLPVIAAAHFCAEGAELNSNEPSELLSLSGQDCINPAVLGDKIVYTALGHLHKAQQVYGGNKVYYAGSPLCLSFAEKDFQHGINEIELSEEGDCEVNRLSYRPMRSLQSIPVQGKAVKAEEVLQEIDRLEKRRKGDDGKTWPYLEIRVDEGQPAPSLLQDVLEALEDCAVHFCRMIRVAPEHSRSERTAREALETETLHSISPLQMARHHFEVQSGSDMPQELIDRFKQAEEAAVNDFVQEN